MKYLKPLKLYKEWMDIKPRKICGRVRALAAFHVDANYVKVAVTGVHGTTALDVANWSRRDDNIPNKFQSLISEYNVMGVLVNSPCIKSTNRLDGVHSKNFIDDLCKMEIFEGLMYAYWHTSFRTEISHKFTMKLPEYSWSIPGVGPLEDLLESEQKILERDHELEMNLIASLMLQGYLYCGKMLNGDAICIEDYFS